MNQERFELSIDHPMLEGAKAGFNACLQAMVARAVGTGSNEGTATLKMAFEIQTADDGEGGTYQQPIIKFKAGYSVPMKDGCEGTLIEKSMLRRSPGGRWLVVNNQITMDEILGDE